MYLVFSIVNLQFKIYYTIKIGDLTNVLQSVAGPQGDRLSLMKVADSNTSKPYIAVYLNRSSDRYGYIPITKD